MKGHKYNKTARDAMKKHGVDPQTGTEKECRLAVKLEERNEILSQLEILIVQEFDKILGFLRC